MISMEAPFPVLDQECQGAEGFELFRADVDKAESHGAIGFQAAPDDFCGDSER
jgi:hypothetical protein